MKTKTVYTMRQIEYGSRIEKIINPEIASLLSTIHEYRGKQSLYMQAKPDTLDQLIEIAKIQSTDASNRIEGISTTEDRLRKLVMDKTTPKSRSEKEIAGYRDVLNTIHQSYQFIPVTPSIILQLHRDLYKYAGGDTGGRYKLADNEITEVDSSGNTTIRFLPVAAWETPRSIEMLCEVYSKTTDKHDIDPLIVLPMFILDFLCIHPFSDGNGRMSRLLTLLLLYKDDYFVGRYISIERVINDTKESYYEALQESSRDWHEETNDYAPFITYLLGVIVAAYREFENRVKLLNDRNLSKPDLIRETIKYKLGNITMAEIKESCPDVSDTTIHRTLKALQDNGDIIKINGGRYTSYIWNREKD